METDSPLDNGLPVEATTTEPTGAVETTDSPSFEWDSVPWDQIPEDKVPWDRLPQNVYTRAFDVAPKEVFEKHQRVHGFAGNIAERQAQQKLEAYQAEINRVLELQGMLDEDPMELGTKLQERAKQTLDEEQRRKNELAELERKQQRESELGQTIFQNMLTQSLSVLPEDKRLDIYRKVVDGNLPTWGDVQEAIAEAKANSKGYVDPDTARKQLYQEVEQELRAKYNLQLGSTDQPDGLPASGASDFRFIEEADLALMRRQITPQDYIRNGYRNLPRRG